ncbi:tRNA ligase [Hypoxylon fragiforme]|uniref:tRNA ligase n=1 Tax=Hypoxylon fragiforme TaxID=63214 RepID=UPI0020C5FBBF|nr:tRNA ligase [Hypoxylon fragiforme]KAI2609335.1 tRNA ligase [Hypoxylon fragiforme]
MPTVKRSSYLRLGQIRTRLSSSTVYNNLSLRKSGIRIPFIGGFHQLSASFTRHSSTSLPYLSCPRLQTLLATAPPRVQLGKVRQTKLSSFIQQGHHRQLTMEASGETSAAPYPYQDQDPEDISKLITRLNRGSRNKALARKTTYAVKGSPDNISVNSWRLQDWDYKKAGLPTYARGLFTAKNRRGQQEIVVRGYDKFFNIDEVQATKWAKIMTNTQGPYELTLKENGCIIFISGLEDGTLLVCSKHSTGDRSDVEVSHASAGERWVDKQLATIGKTREEFARELRRRNATAVAELCDDEFEEHILAYGPEKAGLYLHGVNVNIPEFLTYSSDLVHQFADDWGFRKIAVKKMDDAASVKTFLEGVAQSGAHEGRDVEGFVIRCKMSRYPERAPHTDWFFKFKFEEPYLLYRQWRECTKSLIAGKPPKYKKHLKITNEYLQYARKRLASDPDLAKAYNENHGIIGLRDDFLAYKHMKGSDAANIENENGNEVLDSVTRDVVLVPIATIGCGKTTVGIALTHLFGWGIIQNDNIQGKLRPTKMADGVTALLLEHPVVISDRNNSERREREQIIKDLHQRSKDVRLVALNFAHGDIDEIKRVTRERVLKRGDNHQTIQAASDEAKVLGIMDNFIERFQPCDPDNRPDSYFDWIIDLDPTKDSRANVETVVRELHQRYPSLITRLPSDEEMDEAVKAAIENYKPDLRHTIPDRGKKPDQLKHSEQLHIPKKKKPLEYMSISVPGKEIRVALEDAFKDTDPETQRFYKQLQQTRRIQPLFHVTLMHRASSKENPELWQQYVKLEAESKSEDGKVDECDVQLERVVYDDRVMAIVVRLLDEEGKWKCVNKVPHITVGTSDSNVKPKESNDLLARWLEVGSGGDTGIGERLIDGKTTLKGNVRGVLSR